MKLTRRVLLAANTQLKSQLMACSPESRQGLKAKLGRRSRQGREPGTPEQELGRAPRQARTGSGRRVSGLKPRVRGFGLFRLIPPLTNR